MNNKYTPEHIVKTFKSQLESNYIELEGGRRGVLVFNEQGEVVFSDYSSDGYTPLSSFSEQDLKCIYERITSIYLMN